MAQSPKSPNDRVLAKNRRARFDYEIEDTFEAGVALVGSEVKSLREGRVTLGDGYVAAQGRELFLVGVHIHEYPYANRFNHPPLRHRKLLLHRREIDRIIEHVGQRGYTCIPLRILIRGGRIKVEIGLGRGKRRIDKREDVKERDARREMDRAMKR